MKQSSLRWIAPIAMAFSTSAMAAPQFLNFPVNGYGPNALITTVLDHDVDYDLTQSLKPNQYSAHGPYGYNDGVLSFTGELFVSTASYPPAQTACYPKAINTHQPSAWSTKLQSVYVGTVDTQNCSVRIALNYDNHPGYDYGIPPGKDVHPASGGSIIFTKCIRTFTDSTASNACDLMGAVAVDHLNGFVTQYLHMSNRWYGMAEYGLNQTVTTGDILGKVSSVGVQHAHLHFEVLQRKAVAVDLNNYYARANYMVVDPYGYNTSSYYADLLQSKPGCLWIVGCSY